MFRFVRPRNHTNRAGLRTLLSRFFGERNGRTSAQTPESAVQYAVAVEIDEAAVWSFQKTVSVIGEKIGNPRQASLVRLDLQPLSPKHIL